MTEPIKLIYPLANLYSTPISPEFKEYMDNYFAEREQERKWTFDQEQRQRTEEQHRYHAAQQNFQVNQTLEFRAMPNPFVPRFQNGL